MGLCCTSQNLKISKDILEERIIFLLWYCANILHFKNSKHQRDVSQLSIFSSCWYLLEWYVRILLTALFHRTQLFFPGTTMHFAFEACFSNRWSCMNKICIVFTKSLHYEKPCTLESYTEVARTYLILSLSKWQIIRMQKFIFCG